MVAKCFSIFKHFRRRARFGGDLKVFWTNFSWAILMKRSIFNEWNHVRPAILNEIYGGRSWWKVFKDRLSKDILTCVLIFQSKFLGAIMMKLSIFKGYITWPLIFSNGIYFGEYCWNYRFSNNEITWRLIFQTEFIGASYVWLQTFAWGDLNVLWPLILTPVNFARRLLNNGKSRI